MDKSKLKLDLSLYNEITEKDVEHFFDSINLEAFKPTGYTISLWDGEPFGGLDVETIRRNYGSDFYIVKQNGQLEYLTYHNNLESTIESIWISNLLKEANEYFKEYLKPVEIPDMDNNSDNDSKVLQDLNNITNILSEIDKKQNKSLESVNAQSIVSAEILSSQANAEMKSDITNSQIVASLSQQSNLLMTSTEKTDATTSQLLLTQVQQAEMNNVQLSQLLLSQANQAEVVKQQNETNSLLMSQIIQTNAQQADRINELQDMLQQLLERENNNNEQNNSEPI